jgi:hypothetical protein
VQQHDRRQVAATAMEVVDLALDHVHELAADGL